MDVGAMTVFLLTFTEREKIYNLCEAAHRRAVHDQLHAHRRRFARHAARLVRRGPQVPQRSRRQHRRDWRRCSRATESGWTARKDVGVISKDDAIDYGLSGPNLRGSGVDYDLRKDQPYLCYQDLQFDVPLGSVGDCYDRYLVRMEEMRQSVRLIHQCLDKIPGGFENKSNEPVNVADGKIVLPPKNKVMTSMEELIHQFMLVTEGVNCPPGEIYFGHENPKGELGFYINSRGGGTPYRMKIRVAIVREPEHPVAPVARPHDERHGCDPGLA